jgi:hypothetical protein
MSKNNGNTPAAIRQEIDRLKSDLQTTRAAIENAPAGELGDLSIRAAGIANALPVLAQRLRAADLAEIYDQIAKLEEAARAAQKVAEKADADFQTARQAYDDARGIMAKAPLFSDDDIDRIVKVTTNKTRAELLWQRASYAAAIPRDHIRVLKEDRKELAESPIEV